MKRREIKFRGWDKKEKRITYLGESGEDILYFDQGIFWNRNHDGDDYVVLDFELMQYTGLKDKNGKEIYEGDIVRATERVSWVAEVIWKWHGWGFKHYSSCRRETTFSINERDWVRLGIEVIGNIWENPELFLKELNNMQDKRLIELDKAISELKKKI